MNKIPLRYTIVIQWSNDDDAYVVSLPEWGDLVHMHGDTYGEALQRGQELLELLVQSRRAQ
ncbi:MAG TPA: type II toxin-antitoxin system HicB family antitoxin [Ktedonobacterales bacterium]|jgi:predicted RNase H-like HicB family nuclease|nr:type II toxin-antitoxin system HicB family antitoxin [Ktedonobacterales bacterium]